MLNNIIKNIKTAPSQLKGWPIQNYAVLFFGLGVQAMIIAEGPFSLINIISYIGAVLGIICTISIAVAKPAQGVFGTISAICMMIVAFHSGNYLTFLEHLGFILTLYLPALFSSNWNSGNIAKIRKLTLTKWADFILFTLGLFLISGYLINTFTNDPRSWIDAMSFSVSFSAGIVGIFRFKEQYYWWTASDVGQIILWLISFLQGGTSVAILAGVSIYLLNDIVDFIYSPWYNKKNQKIMANGDDAS